MADLEVRRGRVRVLAAVILGLAGAGVVAATSVGSDSGEVRVGAVGGTLSDRVAATTTMAPPPPPPPPEATPPPETAAPVAPATVATATPPPTTAKPVAPAPTVPAAPAATTATGHVVTIPASGIYAIDVTTRELFRIADIGPFDVAGRRVLTASGTTVSARPATGGDATELYTLTGAERINWLEVNDDGAAVVRLATPVRDGEGRETGSHLYTKLVAPDGTVVVDELPASGEVEWSGDGATLVMHNWKGLHGYRPSGEVAWGPIAPPESILKGLRVSNDGGLATGEFNSHAVKLVEVASGQWRDTGVWRSVSFGPTGQLMGQPAPPPGWSGRDPLGIVRWNPVDGSSSPFSRTGSEPAWAPDGRHAVLRDAPLVGKDDGSRFSLRVRDHTGNAILSLSYAGGPFGRDENVNNVGVAVTGPRWSDDGRLLVVAAL